MYLRGPVILLVKYANPTFHNGVAWVEYKSVKKRSLKRLQTIFAQKPNFRFCIIHEYDSTNKKRLGRVGYFDKNRIDY